MVLGRAECYACHYLTADALDRHHAGEEYFCSWIGWILSDRDIRKLHQEAEKQRVQKE